MTILKGGDVGRLNTRAQIESTDDLLCRDRTTGELFKAPQTAQATSSIESGATTLSSYNRRLTGNWRDFGRVDIDTSKISFSTLQFSYVKTGFFSTTVQVRIADADSGLIYASGSDTQTTRGLYSFDLTPTIVPVPSASRVSFDVMARLSSGFAARGLNFTGIYGAST